MRHSLILPIWWHFSLVNNKYIRFIRNVIKFENKENRIPTARKLKFSIRISSVNVTKSARYCGFGHIYWRNLHFLCSPPPAPPRAHDKNESYTRFSEDIHVFFFSFYVLSICVMGQKSRVNWRCSAVFAINVEYIEHINLAFLVLIFSPLLPTDLVINNSNRIVDKLFVASILQPCH